MKKTIGGDRLGAGGKMQVDLHGYERSTHDLGYIWRSSMASGTLVPFMTEVGLPGDTFDIEFDAKTITPPTTGPLFGSYKLQIDSFIIPIRLYNKLLHNNALNIGLEMNKVFLPQVAITASGDMNTNDADNYQINPSSIFSYLNIRGIGTPNTGGEEIARLFNAVPYLGYWDIYKNYYANKQEEIGAVIHADQLGIIASVVSCWLYPLDTVIPAWPTIGGGTLGSDTTVRVTYTDGFPNDMTQIQFQVVTNDGLTTTALATDVFFSIIQAPGNYWELSNPDLEKYMAIQNWSYIPFEDSLDSEPIVKTFELKNIDDMRNSMLSWPASSPFIVGTTSPEPYSLPLGENNGVKYNRVSQEGLALKTYQSDLFNNWMRTEWIDGDNGINAITAIDTSEGSFTIDTLQLSRKVYDMLNRIAISGGSYNDWLDAVYAHERYRQMEIPMYMGGLSKEIIFDEVVSNSASAEQPLGTLAGRGKMADKHKGGRVTIKVDEPSYIMGIVSITPRLDYSQGNKWDVNLKTMDDLHKPALDEIGFQDLITDQMAWWDTEITPSAINFKSAGKQPAWINYMTNVNQVRGNFAIESNQMWMTLNRRYERDQITGHIKDLTTYVDPAKFNYVFAETARDAQNFWTQIKVDITARRKMSAKVMPNL